MGKLLPNMTHHLARVVGIIATSHRILYPVIYMGILYVLSSVPGAHESPDDAAAAVFRWVPPAIQNLLHVPLYAGLGFLWCWSLRIWPVPDRVLGALVLLLTAGYGFLDEWHQSFVPGRYPSATDAIANAGGAFLGTWLFFSSLRWRHR